MNRRTLPVMICSSVARPGLRLIGQAGALAWPVVLLLLSFGCGKRTDPSPPGSQPTTSVDSLRPAAIDTAHPAWVERSRFWPRALHWTLDSNDEIRQDDLLFRLRGSAIQSFMAGPKAPDHPIMCWFEMTVRPIPTWPHAKGLVLDSVRFRDPVRNLMLPALPMLSSERTYDRATVRTRFTNNLALRHTPELTDGQLLEPVVYFTWDERTIVVNARPVPIRFVYDAGKPGLDSDSVWRWGPEGSG